MDRKILRLIPKTKQEQKRKNKPRIEAYLEEHVTPMLIDIDKRVEELDAKYTRLLKLLEKHLK